MKTILTGLVLLSTISGTVFAHASAAEQLAKAKNIASQQEETVIIEEAQPRQRQAGQTHIIKSAPKTTVVQKSGARQGTTTIITQDEPRKRTVQVKPAKQHVKVVKKHHHHHHHHPEVRYYEDAPVVYYKSAPYPVKRYYRIDPYGRKIYIEQPPRVVVQEPIYYEEIVEPAPRVGLHLQF